MKNNINGSQKFFSNEYQEWYGDNNLSKNVITGITLGLVFYFFCGLFIKKMIYVISFGVSFLDPSSTFAEYVIHLYNVVWIILIFVVFFISVLLIRIIYLFNWKFLYLRSPFFKSFLDFFFDYFLMVGLILEDDNFISSVLNKLNLIESYDIGLNLWYNRDGEAFLYISDISEYRLLEILWCILPISALLFISTPTFSLIFALDACVDPVYTIKVIGHQWYWTYSLDLTLNNTIEDNDTIESKEFKNQLVVSSKNVILINDYNKHEFHLPLEMVSVNLEFDSVMINEEDLNKGSHRLLEVDNRLLLPVGVPVRLLITSSDVLHSWAVPNLGIKVDAVPGRLNQFIVEIKRPGVFYGQCSELCGPLHGFMPIVIQAVSLDKFEEWLMVKSNN